jgi:hypothetical protein
MFGVINNLLLFRDFTHIVLVHYLEVKVDYVILQ